MSNKNLEEEETDFAYETDDPTNVSVQDPPNLPPDIAKEYIQTILPPTTEELHTGTYKAYHKMKLDGSHPAVSIYHIS